MDIDVTRRLRPQKASELPIVSPSPANPPKPAAAPPPAPPPAADPSKTTPPVVEEELHTVRFVPVGQRASDPKPSPAEPDPVTGWLVVMKGLGIGRSLPLGYGIHPLGRGEDQRISVRFGDKRISRRSHVEIGYDGESRKFYVCPGRGGSTFGYLNGQPVLQPSPLLAGDRITVGGTELAFVPFCGEAFDWQKG